jgi:hypothetical protein
MRPRVDVARAGRGCQALAAVVFLRSKRCSHRIESLPLSLGDNKTMNSLCLRLMVKYVMSKRTCLGCGVELTAGVASLEHALPQWLADEIRMPGVSYNHFLRDEDKGTDELLRRHDISGLVIRKVCCACNNGWMSRMENQAKPYILDLMQQKVGVLALSDEPMQALSRWAVKTAFMLTAVQSIQHELPWDLFQNLGKDEDRGPDGCFVFASQQPNLPNASCLLFFQINHLRGRAFCG